MSTPARLRAQVFVVGGPSVPVPSPEPARVHFKVVAAGGLLQVRVVLIYSGHVFLWRLTAPAPPASSETLLIELLLQVVVGHGVLLRLQAELLCHVGN